MSLTMLPGGSSHRDRSKTSVTALSAQAYALVSNYTIICIFVFVRSWLRTENEIVVLTSMRTQSQRLPRVSLLQPHLSASARAHGESPAAKADVLTPFAIHHYIVCILLNSSLS